MTHQRFVPLRSKNASTGQIKSRNRIAIGCAQDAQKSNFPFAAQRLEGGVISPGFARRGGSSPRPRIRSIGSTGFTAFENATRILPWGASSTTELATERFSKCEP